MPLIGKLVGHVERYVPKSERIHVANIPDYKPTVFLIRVLSAVKLKELKNLGGGVVTVTGGVRVSAGSIVYETVREGLAGWENFMGPDGEPLKFKAKGNREGPAHDKALDMIPWDLMDELYDAINELNEVSQREKKASSSAPGSPPTWEGSTAPSAAPDTVTTMEPPGDQGEGSTPPPDSESPSSP